MTDLTIVHVVQGEQQLINDIGTVRLFKMTAIIDLSLHFTTIVEWYD